MPIYAVSLLFSLGVQAPDAPPLLLEFAVHLVAAEDKEDADARARAIGKG